MDSDLIRRDLLQTYQQSSARGLKQTAKWAAELLLSLPPIAEQSLNVSATSNRTMDDSGFLPTGPVFDPDYFMAKSCYDLLEFDRAAFYSGKSSTRECRFLHYYCRYLAADKKRLDLMAETNSNSQITTPINSVSMDISLNLFSELRSDLMEEYVDEGLDDDSFILYVYAIVLLKLDLNDEAVKVLCQSLKADPSNWASWHQLAVVIDDKSMIDTLDLPVHWMKRFFVGLVFLEHQMNEDAILVYEQLLQVFDKSNYVLTQLAIVKDNQRDVNSAIEIFRMIRASDPWRLEALDTYSNLLYVKGMRADLSSLAHAMNNMDPFRVETCCCIGNFYSLRGQHAKAVTYFSRALQLNPKHLSAWTLMGHEYMEMKNTGAAVQAYRSAIKCNKRDFRSWYGLGQTFEILKCHSHSLYYYSIARSLFPNDARLTIAMGDTLDKLERYSDAIKCYWKAGYTALSKLAALYEKLGEKEKAAAAYSDFITRSDGPLTEEITQTATNVTELAVAYKFISSYFFEKKNYEEAYKAAEKCTMFPDTKEHGKQLCSQILKVKSTSS
jgi:anaphase-promoting complex subunit 8